MRKKTEEKALAQKDKVVDEGKLGALNYKVYDRGVIHVYNDSQTMLFKKSYEAFEAAMVGLNLDDMREGEKKELNGSGDNDTLVFTCTDGDIVLSLEKRGYLMAKRLRDIIKKAEVCLKKTA